MAKTKRKPRWAHSKDPVTPREFMALCSRLNAVVRDFFLRDEDGDLPIQLKVIDRTRYAPDNTVEVPMYWLSDDPARLAEALDRCALNFRMAFGAFDNALAHFRSNRARSDLPITAEREACARICVELAQELRHGEKTKNKGLEEIAIRCAALIRKRSGR